MQPVKPLLLMKHRKAVDEFLLQAVELIAALRQLSSVELIFKPQPLKKRRFIQRRGRVGIVFQQFGIAFAVPGKVKARVKRRLTLLP